jgi:hypothetical protein
MKRRNEDLPPIIWSNEVVGLPPFSNDAAVGSRILPLQCGKHTPAPDGLHRQIKEAGATGTFAFVAIGHFLKKRG